MVGLTPSGETAAGGSCTVRPSTTGGMAMQGRDRAIDIIRGLCLISMAAGHVSGTVTGASILNQILHLPLYVDGAAGFVFLSGVSVALADRGRIQRGASRAERASWLIQRTAFLYAVHIALTIAVGVGIRQASEAASVPPPNWVAPLDVSLGGLVEVLTFGHLVQFADVLPLYVVFLFFTTLVVRFDSPRMRSAIPVISVAVYGISLVRPEWSALHNSEGDIVWVLGTWQILFVAGLAAGSRWDELRVQLAGPWRRNAVVLGVAAAVATLSVRVSFAVSDSLGRPHDEAWRQTIQDDILTKWLLPPHRVALAVALGTGLYLVVHWALGRWSRWLDPLAEMGSRSLRVYLVSCLAVVPAWILAGPVAGPVERELAVLAVIAICLATAPPRTRFKGSPWSI